MESPCSSCTVYCEEVYDQKISFIEVFCDTFSDVITLLAYLTGLIYDDIDKKTLNSHLVISFSAMRSSIPGRVDDLPFFEYLSPFCFLSIELHCTFSISYKILPYFVYYYCILVRV